MEGDKKKFFVLGILGVCLVAVGAWQLLGPKPEVTTEATAPDGPEGPVLAQNDPPPMQFDNFGSFSTVRRDPFAPASLGSTQQPEPQPPTQEQPPRPPAPPRPPLDSQVTGTLPGTGLTPAPVEVDEFTYALVGVMEGPSPVAVFQSETGAQTMVKVNGYVGPRSKVVSIQNGRVTVLHNGKPMTLTVGGNSQ